MFLMGDVVIHRCKTCVGNGYGTFYPESYTNAVAPQREPHPHNSDKEIKNGTYSFLPLTPTQGVGINKGLVITYSPATH